MFNKDTKYLILITIIFIAACVETDIYLPAFPDMMIFFHTSEKAIQSLLTWNFFGICISGPFYGPISDSFGRRKPLLAALTFFFIGSVITIFANSFESMLIGRLLQGLGSGGCFTLGTAIIFDAFQKEKAVTAISQLNTIIPLIMAMAPMAGGYLNLAYGFRSNFIAIGIFVLISLFMSMLYFDESLPKEKRQEFKLKKIFLDFKLALTNLALWQVITIISLLFGAYMAFVSATAVLFVVEMGVSRSAFPLFQAAILGAYVLASISCSKAVAKFGLKTVKKTGVSLIAFGGITFCLSAAIYPDTPYVMTAFILFFSFGISWTMTPFFQESMEILPDIKGIVASLITSIRLLLTAIQIGICSAFYDGTIFPIIYMMLISLVIILPCIYFYEKSKNIVLNPETL